MYRMLNKEGDKLAPETYVAFPKERVEIKNDAGQVMKTFVQGIETHYPINHGRRLKRIWQRTKSFEQLFNYFYERGFELKIK